MSALKQVTEAMRPTFANDAWWKGFRAAYEDVAENPYKISGPNGEDGVDYWFWEAGWNYGAYEVRNVVDAYHASKSG